MEKGSVAVVAEEGRGFMWSGIWGWYIYCTLLGESLKVMT